MSRQRECNYYCHASLSPTLYSRGKRHFGPHFSIVHKLFTFRHLPYFAQSSVDAVVVILPHYIAAGSIDSCCILLFFLAICVRWLAGLKHCLYSYIADLRGHLSHVSKNFVVNQLNKNNLMSNFPVGHLCKPSLRSFVDFPKMEIKLFGHQEIVV